MKGTCSIFVFLQVFDHLCGCYIFKSFWILSWVWKSCRNNTVLAFVINDNNNSNNDNNNNNNNNNNNDDDNFGQRFKNSKNSSRYFRMTSNFPESITEIEFDSINQEALETELSCFKCGCIYSVYSKTSSKVFTCTSCKSTQLT